MVKGTILRPGNTEMLVFSFFGEVLVCFWVGFSHFLRWLLA